MILYSLISHLDLYAEEKPLLDHWQCMSIIYIDEKIRRI